MDLLLNNVLNLTTEEVENSKIEFNMKDGTGGQQFLDRWLKHSEDEKMSGTCGQCSYWGWYGKKRNFYTGQWVFSFVRMTYDCDALGFEMDCSHAFEEVYGSASYDSNYLKKVIDDVTDISLLGSAIYSRWRYFNHWAYESEEILEIKNRTWFILALSRLALLSGENL